MPRFLSLLDFSRRGPRLVETMTRELQARVHSALHNLLFRFLRRSTPRRTGRMARAWESIPGAPVSLRGGSQQTTAIGNPHHAASIIAGGLRQGSRGVIGSPMAPEGFGEPDIEKAAGRFSRIVKREARRIAQRFR